MPTPHDGFEQRVSELEKQVAANIVQLAALEAAAAPTRWPTMITAAAVVFAAMVSFVLLFVNPISLKVEDLWTQHYVLQDRLNTHVSDGHPASVIQRIDANRDSDLERDRVRRESAADLERLNEAELNRIRARVQQIEDLAHANAGVRKP